MPLLESLNFKSNLRLLLLLLLPSSHSCFHLLRKRLRAEDNSGGVASLTEMDEEAQLAAAIKASLAETLATNSKDDQVDD